MAWENTLRASKTKRKWSLHAGKCFDAHMKIFLLNALNLKQSDTQLYQVQVVITYDLMEDVWVIK